MLKGLNASLICISLLFVWSCDPFKSVERNTTQKSIHAFKQEEFMEAPFQKREAFQQLSNFLISHADTLLTHAINTSKSNQRFHEFSDYGKGMRDYGFHKLNDRNYLQTHIPAILLDSLKYYLSLPGAINRFYISTNTYEAYDKNKACISLYLKASNKEGDSVPYKIYHIIHTNTKPNKEVLEIKAPYSELVKIKKIAKGLHYEIRVVPNTR